jgi:signal transduction histidine kinase
MHQLEVLRGICHAFGSAADLNEATSSVARWVRDAVAFEQATVRLFLPDDSGELLMDADEPRTDGSRDQARRRSVFTSRSPVQVELGDRSDDMLAVLPLVSRGEPVGVLEVVAPKEKLTARWDVLSAVASQTAILIRNLREKSRLARQVTSMRETVALTRDLMGVETTEKAVRTTTSFFFDQFQLPIAAWLASDEDDELHLLTMRGIEHAPTEELESKMGVLPRWESLAEAEQDQLLERFAHIVGVDDALAADAGEATLIVGQAPSSLQPSLDAVAALLKDVLLYIGTVARAERGSKELDVGLAVAAHEILGPLLATRNSLELLLGTLGASGAYEDLLRRSHKELEQLATFISPLLQWAVGGTDLYRKPIDLVQVTHDAVESCRVEGKEDRISVSAPVSAIVRADDKHLRTAISNVLRNSLAYSPPQSEVLVTFETTDEHVTFAASNKGPSIPPAERKTIFDPFARGRAGNLSKEGFGLGLFIARRVVEAHQGSIWVESSGGGATFRIRLPRGQLGGAREPVPA